MNNYQYLKEIRYAFHTKIIPKKYFILGNSTCDMDSALSAYLLSIGKNIRHKCIEIDDTNVVSLNKEAKEIYVPVINCKRGEYESRLDGKFVFDKFKVNLDDFFYINDVELSQTTFNDPKNDYNIILVDHSKLDESISYLSDYVIEIIDHHFTRELKYSNLKNIFIKYPCGSCTTLILMDYFLSKFPHTIIPSLLATTAILLDTENFNQKYYGNRWTEMDKIVYDKLINESQTHVDVEKYYKDIFQAKFDVEKNLALGLDILMRKDKKNFKWNKFITEWSSLTISLNKIIEKFTFEKVIEYIDNNYKGKIDFYVMLSTIDKDLKEAIIYSVKGEKVDINNMGEFLKSKMSDKYKAIEKKENNENIIVIKLNTTASRKSVEPVLNEYFSKL